jgi:hypothetical protein
MSALTMIRQRKVLRSPHWLFMDIGERVSPLRDFFVLRPGKSSTGV